MGKSWGIAALLKTVVVIFSFSVLQHPAYGAPSDDLYKFWQNLYAQSSRQEYPSLQIELLSKAPIDECFYGIGDPRNAYAAATCDQGRWKVNGGQVWGMVKSGSKLWFGTRENPMCVTMGMSGVRTPLLTDFEVCEFGQSFLAPYLPESMGDWRPPFIYEYDLATGKVLQKKLLLPGLVEGLPIVHGTRGAAQKDGIVLMAAVAGIDAASVSVVLFAFNSDTGQFLGWTTLLDSNGIPYKNTRHWLSYRDQVYGCLWVENGGRILRWLGDTQAIKSGDLASLWKFEEVGVMDQQPSTIAVYNGNRLVVGTRQTDTKRLLRGGELWLSPPFDDHLSANDAGKWKVVWSVAQYDPDLVSAATTAIGALAFFDGYLWWGTETEIGKAWEVHKQFYGKIKPGYPTDEESLAALYGTWRPLSLFRGCSLENTSQQIELVSGFNALPKFTFDTTSGLGRWDVVPNRMGKQAWGIGGLGNWYQVQAYSMTVFGGKLFLGTNEYSHRIGTGGMQLPTFPLPQPPDQSLWGAELWRIDNVNSYPVAESLSGIGNYLNTAVRNMIADDAIYIGTGNTNNLATVEAGGVLGGWEVLRLTTTK